MAKQDVGTSPIGTRDSAREFNLTGDTKTLHCLRHRHLAVRWHEGRAHRQIVCRKHHVIATLALERNSAARILGKTR
jgi:hypothetical protein